MAFGGRLNQVVKGFWKVYLVEGRRIYFVKEKMKMLKVI